MRYGCEWLGAVAQFWFASPVEKRARPSMRWHFGRRAVLAGFAFALGWGKSGTEGSDFLTAPARAGPLSEPMRGVHNEGAARWLEQSEFVASSLEVGRV